MKLPEARELPERSNMLCYAALPPQESFNSTASKISQYGFAELSLWMDAVEQGIRENGSATGLRHYLQRCNLRVSVLEFLYSWPAAELGDHCAEAEQYRDLAIDLEAEVMMCGCLQASIDDTQTAIHRLRQQCDILAKADRKMALEFLPWSAISTLPKALELIQQVNRSNLGLVIDTWHFARAGHTAETLRLIQKEPVFVVQLSDAAKQASDCNDTNLMEETMNARLLPGEGSTNWIEMSDWFRANCQEAIFGAEVFNSGIRSMPLEQALETLASVSERALQHS